MAKLFSEICRVGNGIDIHATVKGRDLILGGVQIEHDYGCGGHSDGDVLIHSIIDAILGALGKGDIGDYFPSSDKQWQGANSLKLLNNIYYKCIDNGDGWSIANIDSTIILQSPIVKPYIEKMKDNIMNNCLSHQISIKATITDYLGFIGDKKGIAAVTTCLLIQQND